MLIGIISDTHDNLPQIKKAVDFFKEQKIEALIHAGDYCAPFSLKPYETLKIPCYGVFGNIDGDKEMLGMHSGGCIKEPPLKFDLDGKKILVTHDITSIDIKKEVKNNDLIIFGHTHAAEVKKEGKAYIVNPGECCGYVNGKSSVALCDLQTMKVTIHKLKL